MLDEGAGVLPFCEHQPGVGAPTKRELAMNHIIRRRRSPPEILGSDVWTPGDEIQLDALIAACALVAQADGRVRREERQRMIDRMRRTPAVAVFGVQEVLLGFETLSDHLARDWEDGAAVAEAAVRRLAGKAGVSRLLIETASAVARADGDFDAEERVVVLRLSALLGLSPSGCATQAHEGAAL